MSIHWHSLVDHYEDLLDERGSIQSWVEALIHGSTLEEEYKLEAESYLHLIDDNEELQNIIIPMLLQSQKHPVRDGLNYSQKQLNKYLDEKI
jgi:hypothetical protein